MPHHQFAGAGRRLPVDVAAVVARDVGPEGVEVHVCRRDVRAGVPLEVVDESRLLAGKPDRARVHVDLQLLGPAGLPARERERVALHGVRRPDDDEAAAVRRDPEGEPLHLPGAHDRQREARLLAADGKVQPRAEVAPGCLVADDDLAGGAVAHHDCPV
nr:hypothetical protein [Tessaracoccus timonensis]